VAPSAGSASIRTKVLDQTATNMRIAALALIAAGLFLTTVATEKTACVMPIEVTGVLPS
jgi:hypothetical protein